MIGGTCVSVCMSVLCLRGGCIFCVTFPALAFSCLFRLEHVRVKDIIIDNVTCNLCRITVAAFSVYLLLSSK